MNRTILLLGIADVFFVTGFGLIDPILAIFIKEELVGATIISVGIATALFLLVKSCVQLPFSRYIDAHDDHRKWIITGSFVVAVVPLLYLSATSISLIYVAQILLGLGSGITYPAWLGLWSKSLDSDHQSFEWSLYSTATGLATALTAAIGAIIAQYLGFTITFLIVTFLALVGSSFLFGLEHKRITKVKIKPHTVKSVRGM